MVLNTLLEYVRSTYLGPRYSSRLAVEQYTTGAKENCIGLSGGMALLMLASGRPAVTVVGAAQRTRPGAVVQVLAHPKTWNGAKVRSSAQGL